MTYSSEGSLIILGNSPSRSNRMGTMDATRVAIDTKDLTKGMYVIELDRPWLETPFVFQDFEISNTAEIDILKSCCDWVCIDTERGSLKPGQVRALKGVQLPGRMRLGRSGQQAAGSGRVRRWIRDLLLRFDLAWLPGGGSNGGPARYPIVSTVRRESDRAVAAFEAACAFHASMLRAIPQTIAVDTQSVRLAMRPVIESILRNPSAMAWVIFSRKSTPADYNRAVATAVWCVMFGRHLAFDRQRLEDLAVGGLLLDIGYLGLPAALGTVQGELTDELQALQKKHVEIGVEILRASGGVPENVIDMVRCHQERADGSGYPAGLKASATPSFGRIAAIADCYDAMTSENAYSSAAGGYDAARALNDMRGEAFQPEVVEQFLRAVGMFPTGSIVELNDGTAGVVLEQNPNNALRPKVLLLRDKSQRPLSKPLVKQLRDLPANATIRKALWIVNGHPHGTFGIDPRTVFN